MKKLIISIFLVIIVSSGGYYAYSFIKEKNDPAIIIIDGRKIRVSDFLSFKPEGKPCDNKDKCIEGFIEEQILVSEGLKDHLDRHESMKGVNREDFSKKLAQLVIKEKMKSMEAAPSKEELESYLSLHKGSITLTSYRYDDLESAKSGGSPSGSTTTTDFEELSGPVAYIIGTLSPGGKTMPFETDKGFEVIQLDMVEQNLGSIEKLSDDEKKQISERLENDKRLYLLKKWKTELKNKADIKRTEKFSIIQ